MVHDNRSTFKREPIFTFSLVQKIQIELSVITLFHDASVHGFGRIGNAFAIFSFCNLSIIRPGNAVDTKAHRMRRSEVNPVAGFIVKGHEGLVDRKIAGIADIRMLDNHIFVLPVIHIAGGRQLNLGVVGVGAQHTHVYIVMIPVVPHK